MAVLAFCGFEWCTCLHTCAICLRACACVSVNDAWPVCLMAIVGCSSRPVGIGLPMAIIPLRLLCVGWCACFLFCRLLPPDGWRPACLPCHIYVLWLSLELAFCCVIHTREPVTIPAVIPSSYVSSISYLLSTFATMLLAVFCVAAVFCLLVVCVCTTYACAAHPAAHKPGWLWCVVSVSSAGMLGAACDCPLAVLRRVPVWQLIALIPCSSCTEC